MKVSVVISAYNEAARIEECLKSVDKIASEIIFIDNTSTDNTVEVARKYTDKIFTRENNLMLNTNKNFGFSKASGPWILSLDADERIEEELAAEILAMDEDSLVNGYFIPRKNIIFGKWIQHAGWYPDYQMRLFRKDCGRFEEKHVHELLSVDGPTEHLKNPLYHLNYENISQFLDKMIRVYTISEANSKIEKGYIFDHTDIFRMPISEFVSRFFLQKGYKDGIHGLNLSLLMAFYHFVVFLRLWEKNNYPESQETLQLFSEGKKALKKEVGFWEANEKLNYEKNPLKKQLYKITRKKNSS